MRTTARKSKEQLQKEARTKSIMKSIKKIYQRYEIKVHKVHEIDLMNFLNSKDNRQQYIKNLIIEDMRKSNK